MSETIARRGYVRKDGVRVEPTTVTKGEPWIYRPLRDSPRMKDMPHRRVEAEIRRDMAAMLNEQIAKQMKKWDLR